jgi:hypothetical protein
MTGYQRYIDMTDKEKWWFRSYLVTDFHHILIVCFAYVNHFNCCIPGSEFPVDDNGAWPKYFTSETCFFQPHTGYGKILMFTIGYLCVDFVGQIWNYSGDQNDTLMLVHHVVSVAGFYSAFYAGHGLPGIASLSLFCEISSIPLSFHTTFIPKEYKGGLFANLNQVVFLITYTIFRMVNFSYIMIR